MGGVMTRDDIIHMARESQRERFSDGGYWFSMEVRDLAVFAALVAAADPHEPQAVTDATKPVNEPGPAISHCPHVAM